MRDVNKVILMGRLGADPVQRTTKNGNPVTHFSVATSRKLRPSGAMEEPGSTEARKWEEETMWHSIVVWGKQAEHCAQYLKKGNAVYLEGSLRSRQYEAKDGKQKMAFEVHAEEVHFISRPYRKRADDEGVVEAAAEMQAS